MNAQDKERLMLDFIQSHRGAGTLYTLLAEGEVRYQASTTHEGCIERLTTSGVEVGTWEDGEFVPLPLASL